MAEVAFHYINTSSPFHRLDPRTKTALLLGLSITGTLCRRPGLLILIPVVVTGLVLARLPLKQLVRELRPFIYFFLLIIAVSTVDISRTQGACGRILSIDGFLQGLITVTRMLYVILLAFFFTSTTRSREMRDAVWWFLHRFPFINAARISLMFSLSISFIPLVFEQAATIGNSLTARGTTGRPVGRLKLTAFPLIVSSFRRVDMITSAMLSRCYTDEAVKPKLKFHRLDLVYLVCAALVCAAVLLL